MSNYTYQHDPRISGADFEDNEKPDLCPKCGTEMDYHEDEDGHWCAECLVWYMGFMGEFIPFDEVSKVLNGEAK
jgi:hypothetical protein